MIYRRILNIRAEYLWLVSGIYIACNYAALGVMPGLWQWLSRVSGDHGLFVINAATSAFAVLLFAWLVFVKKENSFLRYCLFAALFGCLFLLGLLEENPGEKIHIPQYFLAGILFFASLKKSGLQGLTHVCIIGGAVCLGAGLFDEVIQLLLPNRSFRWHDVFVNCVSGLIGLLVMKVIAASRTVRCDNPKLSRCDNANLTTPGYGLGDHYQSLPRGRD